MHLQFWGTCKIPWLIYPTLLPVGKNLVHTNSPSLRDKPRNITNFMFKELWIVISEKLIQWHIYPEKWVKETIKMFFESQCGENFVLLFKKLWMCMSTNIHSSVPWKRLIQTVTLQKDNSGKLTVFLYLKNYAHGCPNNLYNSLFLPNGISYEKW